MKKERRNNKGFSLVELIVVIAIMAILAVTLAPRLTQYIEKARVASDRQVLDSIFNAAKLANIEYPLGISQTLNLKTVGADPADRRMYEVTDKKWTLNPNYNPTANTFAAELKKILSAFTLQQNAANSDATLVITTDANGLITVTLDIDGAGSVAAISVSE